MVYEIGPWEFHNTVLHLCYSIFNVGRSNAVQRNVDALSTLDTLILFLIVSQQLHIVFTIYWYESVELLEAMNQIDTLLNDAAHTHHIAHSSLTLL